MGPSSNHNCSFAGSTDILECRDVIRYELINLCIWKFPHVLQLHPIYYLLGCQNQVWREYSLRARFPDWLCSLSLVLVQYLVKYPCTDLVNSGVLADNCTSRFGRRRPYMLLGTVICITAMLLLGFTRQVASIFTGWKTHAVRYILVWNELLLNNLSEWYPHNLARRFVNIFNRLFYKRW